MNAAVYPHSDYVEAVDGGRIEAEKCAKLAQCGVVGRSGVVGLVDRSDGVGVVGVFDEVGVFDKCGVVGEVGEVDRSGVVGEIVGEIVKSRENGVNFGEDDKGQSESGGGWCVWKVGGDWKKTDSSWSEKDSGWSGEGWSGEDWSGEEWYPCKKGVENTSGEDCEQSKILQRMEFSAQLNVYCFGQLNVWTP